MPSDPYKDLPNLTGVPSAGAVEGIRSSGDPSRFYPSPRGGTVDAVTGRILDVPRFHVYKTTDYVAGAGFTDFMYWDGVLDDNDGMTKGPNLTPYVNIKTPGLWYLKAFVAWSNPVFTQWLWARILASGSHAGAAVIQSTTQGIAPGFGTYQEASGQVQLVRGDSVSLYLFTNAAVTIQGGTFAYYLQGHLAGTDGSDNQ